MDLPSSSETNVSPTLVLMAKKIAEAFPGLEGRAAAISEIVIDENFMPILPSAFVAFEKDIINDQTKSGQKWITEKFVIEFWLKSQRDVDPNTGDMRPYWALYDHGGIRDALLLLFRDWVTPEQSKIALTGVDVEVSDAAVVIGFTGQHEFRWCAPDSEGDKGSTDWTFTTRFITPPSAKCECTDCEPEEDVCQDESYRSSI